MKLLYCKFWNIFTVFLFIFQILINQNENENKRSDTKIY